MFGGMKLCPYFYFKKNAICSKEDCNHQVAFYKLTDKTVSLPSTEILMENHSKGLSKKIRAMDQFLCENDIDAEREGLIGSVWCENNMFCLRRGRIEKIGIAGPKFVRIAFVM